MVGESGLYETPSEYVRDLIRRDMVRREGQFVQDAILAGYRDLASGRVFASSGDFKADMATLDRKDVAEYFDVSVENGRIILTPVRIQPAQAVRDKLEALGISEQDVDDAVNWARRG